MKILIVLCLLSVFCQAKPFYGRPRNQKQEMIMKEERELESMVEEKNIIRRVLQELEDEIEYKKEELTSIKAKRTISDDRLLKSVFGDFLKSSSHVLPRPG